MVIKFSFHICFFKQRSFGIMNHNKNCCISCLTSKCHLA